MTLTKVLRDMSIDDATVHGFRSSFRDWAAEQTSAPGDVVEAALAHTIANRVEAAYRRTNRQYWTAVQHPAARAPLPLRERFGERVNLSHVHPRVSRSCWTTVQYPDSACR